MVESVTAEMGDGHEFVGMIEIFRSSASYVRLVLERVQKYYADRLLAFAIYGSYARRENRMNSDLDLLIVLREASIRRERIEEFITEVEMFCESEAQELYEQDVCCVISHRCCSSRRKLSSFSRFTQIWRKVVSSFSIVKGFFSAFWFQFSVCCTKPMRGKSGLTIRGSGSMKNSWGGRGYKT
ncbi:MAG: nucleotidyltransferase domain-containing protein [Kyrpidia sp.]|nr:nucleotidyltransferase domain-containing protein [Kyrpidia sp.]